MEITMDTTFSIKKFENTCRTCLKDEAGEMHDIFEYGKELKSFADMLCSYTSLTVNMADQLPKKVCNTCYYCLLNFHYFTINASKADIKFKEYFTRKEEIQKEEKSGWDVVHVKKSEINTELALDKSSECSYSSENNIENNTATPLTDKIEIHSKIRSFKLRCEICNKVFKKQSIYKHHMQTHTKEYDYSRQMLPDNHNFDQPVVKQEDIEKKYLTPDSTTNNNQNLVCQICSFTFKSIPSLSAHQRAHIPKNRVLQCTICSKIFKKLSHLKRHEITHIDNRLYKCNICPKSFAMEDNLKAHLNKHKGIQNHYCPICSKAFAHLEVLTNHIKVHRREKPYLCPTCGKMFDSSTNLNQHMKRHTGLRLFACNLCPAKFISKGELKSHSLTHTGERPFTCDLCNAAFTKRCYLERHKFTHLGVKPHQCDVCGVKFSDKNHLKRHYRIHTGEKPYRCDICERAYTQSNDLVKHKRTHLGNNVYKCDECSQSFRLKIELRQHLSEHFISAQMQSKVDSNVQTPMEDGCNMNEIQTAEHACDL